MKYFAIIAAFFTLVFAGNLTAAQADTTIGVLDMRKLVEESEAGKNIATQLKTRRDAIQKEANDFEKKLKDEEQAILKNRATMKQEEFETKKKAFEQEYVNSRDAIFKKTNDLETDRKKALAQLQTGIAKAAADVADAKKLQVILDRTAVVIAEQTMDITADVMKKLNETVKTVSVTSGK